MTADLEAAAAEMIKRTTAEQGLSFHVTDDAAIRTAAVMLRVCVPRDAD